MERFKLQFHHEMKEVSGFGLLVSKGGLKITEDHEQSGEGPSMRAGPARDGLSQDASFEVCKFSLGTCRGTGYQQDWSDWHL